MLNHFAKILKNRPLLAIEHMMYLLLITMGVWGLSPSNNSLTIERLVNQFGVYVVVAQYSAFLLVGLFGHLSIITVRIEHRVMTTKIAFFAFMYALIANVAILLFGGIFNPISTMMNSFAALVAGIIHLHLRAHQRAGATGRWRYMR